MIQPQAQPLHQSSHPQLAGDSPTIPKDEIDLLQLLKSIIRTWKPLVISLVIVSIIWIAVKAFQVVFIANETTYSKPIRLTFANAQKLVFPSGAKFSYGDIVAPAVVQKVFDANNLSQYGITISDLQSALTSGPYAPTYPLIIRKYKIALSNKKLTIEDMAEMQKKMQLELDQVTMGEALISLRLYKKDIPVAVASKILNDIPATWAERTIQEKGVLNINAQIASGSSLNAELINQEDELIVNDLLNQKIDLLKGNIKKLTDYEGAQSVKDPKTGMKLIDLLSAVNDLQQFDMANLLSPVVSLGLSRDPKLSLYHFENKARRLNVDLYALKKQAESIKYILDSHANSEQSNPVQNGEKTNSQIMTPQITMDMLDKLANLAGVVEKEKYKQKINKDWLDISHEIAATEGQIVEAQGFIATLQKTSLQADNSPFQQQYLAKVRAGLPKVIEKMSGYFDVSERIYKQLSIESVGIADKLYLPITSGVLVSNISFDVYTFMIVWAALMFLTVIIVVPVCMIRNAMKEQKLAK